MVYVFVTPEPLATITSLPWLCCVVSAMARMSALVVKKVESFTETIFHVRYEAGLECRPVP